MNKSAISLAFCSCTLLLALVTSLCVAEPLRDEKYWMQRSDLVVRGKVRGSHLVEVPVSDIVPADKRDATQEVLVIDIDVDEVLKGYSTGSPLPVAMLLDVHKKFVVGTEMVLPLTFWKSLMGGSFIVTNQQSVFVRIGDEWLAQGAPVSLRSIDELRYEAQSGAPEALYAQSSSVVLGEIINIATKDVAGATIALVDFDVESVLKGPSGHEEHVRFRVVLRGGEELGWKTVAPTFEAGQDWLLFLARDSEGLYLLDGALGAFEVDGADLIQGGRRRLVGGRGGIQRIVVGGDPRAARE